MLIALRHKCVMYIAIYQEVQLASKKGNGPGFVQGKLINDSISNSSSWWVIQSHKRDELSYT